jgi:hypothetical protein
MGQREQQRRVSQKMAYARWHLEWSQQQVANDQQRLALLESACWHTLGAYRAFLGEIAADVHKLVDQDHADTVSAVSLSQAYSDYLPAALAECANLEGQQGWLRQLLCWSESINRGDAVIAPQAAANVISSSDDSPLQLDSSSLLQVLDRLDALIERLRGDMLEF